jgi:hypothetical protein
MILIAGHFRQALCNIVITPLIQLNLVQFLAVVEYSEQQFSETLIRK